MKFKTKITKKSLTNHFKYYVWVYVVAMVLCTTFFGMSVTVINNQAPPESKLFTYICGEAISIDYLTAFYEELDGAMREKFPEMKVISCENLAYNSQSTLASTYKEKFLSLVSGKYGDVMLLPYNEFADLAQNGLFEPLEDDFADYLADVDEISLKTVTMTLNNYESLPETHVYGIPLSHLKFFPYFYDTTDKVLVITSYSQNKEKAKVLAEWYLDYMIETEWYGTLTRK